VSRGRTATVAPVDLVVLAAASYRLTHVLVGTDSVLEELHQKLNRANYETDECDEILSDDCNRPIFKPHVGIVRKKASELVVCPHCLGYWVGLGMLCMWSTRWPWQLGRKGWLASLAVAGGQSFLAAVDGRA